jgi:xanthine dehydrogenase YagS FAD-binding subunit
MNAFEFVRARTVAEAIAAGSAPGAAFLAGGTNLVDLMKVAVSRPPKLVDIGGVEGLAAIETRPDGALRIGALVANSELARGPFASRFPLVAEAVLSGASPQLRNAATVAGNLMQRTRCAYFFDAASACNKRTPGAGCDAKGGEARTQAILGWSEHCVATHPSDLCVALAALSAIVEIDGPAGRRDIPINSFYRLPGGTPERESELAQGELIVAVRLPASAAAFAGHSHYLKVRDRVSYAFALASCAAALRLENGVIAEARIALGGVAAKPWRAEAAEAGLAGAKPEDAALVAAAAVALADAKPSGDNAFKIELARRVVTRALRLAAAGTPKSTPALPASPFGGARG